MSNVNTLDSETDLLNMYASDDVSKRASMITSNPPHSLTSTDAEENTGSEILDTYSQMVRRDISDDEDIVGDYSDSANGSQILYEESEDNESIIKKDDESAAQVDDASVDAKDASFDAEDASFDAEDARSGFIHRSSSPTKTIIDPEYSDSSSDEYEEEHDESNFDVPDLDDEEEKDDAIVDDTGNVIDIPQKSRVVSTYSEVGSTWNAFPNMGNSDDVQTIITDVKTIYDNNTLMNVPLPSQKNLPPLPKIETLDIGDNKLPPLPEQVTPREEEEDKMSFTGASTFDAGKNINDKQSILPLNFANEKKKVPELALIKLIQDTKATHEQKLKQLNKYSQELAEYDTGVSTWINNTLKSNSELKLKEDYVMNKHVKEAYSNAEQLSKRNNNHLVSDLNQNMQQLTKKVFTSSMRGKSKSFLKSLRDKTTT